MNNTYQIIEDDGGTLHMYVKNAAGEYIFAAPMLPEDVQEAIKNLADAGVWDEDLPLLAAHLGVEEITSPDQLPAAREAYRDSFAAYEYGWSIIADSDGIYPERMGYAGAGAFGVTLD